VTSALTLGSPTRSIPKRRAGISPLRRASRTVLIAGTAVSALAAFGPPWAVRVGIALAMAAAVVACFLAWREINIGRRDHAKAMLAASRAHGEGLRKERTHNAAVLDTLAQRARNAAAQIETQQVVIGDLLVKIATLRGDKAQLNRELKQREHVISELRHTVRTQEAEMVALQRDETELAWGREQGGGAEVHLLPRRMLAELSVDDAANELDMWTEASQPTVVDLVAAEVPVVLPNYEGDRRRA
jgi:hypothetical protein